MSDRFTFSSAGLVHELEMAMDRAGGYNAALVKRMCEGDRLTHIREYLLGQAVITAPEHLINCDADPFVPNGWSVEEHQKGGQFEWNRDVQKDALWLSNSQKNGNRIEGNKLRKELRGKSVLNANVLDYLLKNPHLIPEGWKKDENSNTRYTFFWGTIYRASDGGLYVRCLHWRGGGWRWRCRWLGRVWHAGRPAAVSAS
ncbi:MAG: hypothetical protein Q8R36_01870 [bacterium]|nr:hypothetical protein [bacterium]